MIVCMVLSYMLSNITSINCEYGVKWPCQWSNGTVPYVFDMYSRRPGRLIKMVNAGLEYLQRRSCLTFVEVNPVELTHVVNYTYLFFSYSSVLENCCLGFYQKEYGRRLVLITPRCSLPGEVAHATLHGLGLRHASHASFDEREARILLFATDCEQAESRKLSFDS